MPTVSFSPLPSYVQPHDKGPDIAAMLQQQQAVLSKILEKQELSEQKQKDIELKLHDVEAQLSKRAATLFLKQH